MRIIVGAYQCHPSGYNSLSRTQVPSSRSFSFKQQTVCGSIRFCLGKDVHLGYNPLLTAHVTFCLTWWLEGKCRIFHISIPHNEINDTKHSFFMKQITRIKQLLICKIIVQFPNVLYKVPTYGLAHYKG